MGKPSTLANRMEANRKKREDKRRAAIKEHDEYDSRRRACFETVMFYIHERMKEAVDERDRDIARLAYKASHQVANALENLFPEWVASGASDDFIKPFEKLTGYIYGNKPR